MSDVLRRLAIALGADTAEFEEGLKEAANVAKEAFEEITKSAVITGELVAEGLEKAVDMFKEMAEQSIEYGAHLADMSQKYGVSAEALSQYGVAAKMSGTDLESVGNGLRHLDQAMVSSVNGNAEAKAAFAALGITVEDSHGHMKDATVVMDEVAEKFSETHDGAAKTAIAIALFGKTGADLIPMLDKGRDGMEEAKKMASDLGWTFTDETSSAARELEERMQLIGLATQGNARSFMTELMPALLDVSDAFMSSSHSGSMLEGIADLLGFSLKMLATAFLVVKASIEAVIGPLMKLLSADWEILNGNFRQAWAILKDDSNADQVTETLYSIGDLWNGVAESASKAAEAQDKAKKPDLNYDYHKHDNSAAKKAQKASEAAERELESVRRLLSTKTELEDQAYSEEVGKVIAGFNLHKITMAEEARLLTQLGAHHKAELDKIAKDEDSAHQAELEKAKQEFEALQKHFESKRQLEDDDFKENIAKVQAMINLDKSYTQQGQLLIRQITADHNAKLKAMDDELQQQRIDNINTFVNFSQQSLDALGKKHAEAARAAKEISKAQALFKIAADTRTAAMAAYSALAGIPVVGPALGVAAAAAAVAFGAAQAEGVASGSIGAGATTASSVPSSSSSTNQTQPGTTILHVPSDAIMTGRQIVNYLNQAVSSGSVLNLQVVAT